MLEAAVQMGTHLGDTATVAAAQAAAAAAIASMKQLLWNSTYSYFRAYTGGDAVMSDALYGIEVAHHHGLGLLWPTPGDLINHLAAEEKYNYDAGGLKTITGRHTPPPAGAGARAAGPDTQCVEPLACFRHLRLESSAGPGDLPPLPLIPFTPAETTLFGSRRGPRGATWLWR